MNAKENLQWKAQNTGLYTKEGQRVFLFDGPIARISLPENAFIVTSYQVNLYKKAVKEMSFLRKSALSCRKGYREGFTKKSFADWALISALENKRKIKHYKENLSYIVEIAETI